MLPSTPRPGPRAVGTFAPPDPGEPTFVGAPTEPPSSDDAEILRDVDAVARGVLAVRRRKLTLLAVAGLLVGRSTATCGPLSPAAATTAVIDSVSALRQELHTDRLARVQRDSARDAAVIAALTVQALVLCELAPRPKTQAHGFPCRRLQDGERYPLYGGAGPVPGPLYTAREAGETDR